MTNMSLINVSARQTKQSDPLKDIEDNFVTDDEDCDDVEHLSARQTQRLDDYSGEDCYNVAFILKKTCRLK